MPKPTGKDKVDLRRIYSLERGAGNGKTKGSRVCMPLRAYSGANGLAPNRTGVCMPLRAYSEDPMDWRPAGKWPVKVSVLVEARSNQLEGNIASPSK